MKRIDAVYLFVVVTAFFYFTGSFPSFADDPGVGWHLSTGFDILNHGRVPTTDPFLSVPRPWISDQWLSDLIMSGLYDAGGWPLLYCIGALTYLAAFFFASYRPGCRAGIHPGALVAAAACMAKLGSVHFILRPVLVSFLFFASLYGMLYTAARSGEYRILATKRSLLFLPCLSILWTNMHPSFLLGMLLLGLFIGSLVFEKFFLKAPVESESTDRSLFAAAVFFLAGLANPYGFRLHSSVLELARSRFFMNLHEEWQPLSLASGEGGQFCFVLFFVFFGVYLFDRRRLNISVFEAACFILFGYLSLESVRYLPYFSLTAVPLFASVLGGCSKQRTGAALTETRWFPAFGAIVVIATFLAGRVPFYQGEYGPSKERYPYGAVERLRSEFPGRESITVFNHPNYGGFLVWEGKGWIKPVMDDRNTLAGEETYERFLRSTAIDARISDYAAGADAFLIRQKDAGKQCNVLEGAAVLERTPAWILGTVPR